MKLDKLRERIEALAAGSGDVRGSDGRAIDEAIDLLDDGSLRVAQPDGDDWQVNAWVKSAILLYFARRDVAVMGDEHGLQFYDKLPVKRNYKKLGVRCVPPGVARHGSFLGRGTILMPGFVNIGAYVDEGSMIDTWATVGSCAQIGKNVHLSGGVGIGGVLEPPQAAPVIIEDGAFVGSRCIVVEGRARRTRSGAGRRRRAHCEHAGHRRARRAGHDDKGRIPPRAVVIPGTIPKTFPAGEYGVPCALIIGTRTESTDRKTSLNAALRDFEVAV